MFTEGVAFVPVALALVGFAHPAAPLSPVATRYVIPSAAACDASDETVFASVCVNCASQDPKLSVITSARLLSMIYISDKSTPSAVFVVFETTNFTAAPGAIAEDHSLSKSASSRSGQSAWVVQGTPT